MSEKTLKFGNVVGNKKEFHASKKPIALNLIDIDKIVVSDKFKHYGKTLNDLLVTKMIISLDLWVLFYLK